MSVLESMSALEIMNWTSYLYHRFVFSFLTNLWILWRNLIVGQIDFPPFSQPRMTVVVTILLIISFPFSILIKLTVIYCSIIILTLLLLSFISNFSLLLKHAEPIPKLDHILESYSFNFSRQFNTEFHVPTYSTHIL